jgi:hypothetical protein
VVSAERHGWLLLLGALLLGAVACSEPADPASADARDGATTCQAPSGLSLSGDVESLRVWINALPKPTSLPCLLESLPRPIRAHAAQSQLSAQPSAGAHNPRFFLFDEPLIMTITPSGIGSDLLELSVLESATRSVKAEIHFPVSHELLEAEPYERALFNDELTSCAFCHADERPVPSITFTRAFSSEALKPDPRNRVAVSSMLDEAARCDGAAEPARCQMLGALLDHGAVVEHEFPAAMRVCFASSN